MDREPSTVTVLLQKMSSEEGEAPSQLLPLVYEELRKLAGSYMRSESANHTLQPTALVHEAYLRLVDWQNVTWQNRAHFFAVAATVMRQVLVDHARSKKAAKRGGGLPTIALDEAVSFPSAQPLDLVVLNEALDELETFDPKQAKIVELRFFGGLTIDETAHTLGLSAATVKREWQIAKAWLYARITT